MGMITLRYELMVVGPNVYQEEIETPSGWEAMSDAEREQWCLEALEDGMPNYVGTSFDLDSA